MNTDSVVRWQDAEDALIEAFECLFGMPDRERAFLSAGTRSCWPDIVRATHMGDYGDGQSEHQRAAPAPSPQRTRRMVARLDAVLTGPRAAALAIPEGQRSFVGRVLVMRRWPGPDGFRWERVWEREGGRRSGTTADALRKRYERAIGKLAMRMTVLGLGADAGCARVLAA